MTTAHTALVRLVEYVQSPVIAEYISVNDPLAVLNALSSPMFQALSHGEQTILRAAADILNGTGHAHMADLRRLDNTAYYLVVEALATARRG